MRFGGCWFYSQYVYLCKYFILMTLMLYITNSPVLQQKLALLSKFSTKVMVTPNSLNTENIRVQLNPFTDVSFTVGLYPLIKMLKSTEVFKIINNELFYDFKMEIKNKEITVKNQVKIYDDVFEIIEETPYISIFAENIKIISEDNHEIKVDSTGNLQFNTYGIIETKALYSNLEVKQHNRDEQTVYVKAKDLKVLEEFKRKYILSFYESYIMAHIYEDEATTTIRICLLNRLN